MTGKLHIFMIYSWIFYWNFLVCGSDSDVIINKLELDDRSRNTVQDEAVFRSRNKRSASESEKQRIVNKHNELRRRQNAANMNLLVSIGYASNTKTSNFFFTMVNPGFSKGGGANKGRYGKTHLIFSTQKPSFMF